MRSSNSIAKKAIAFLVIALFCFQFGKIYLLEKVSTFYECPHTLVWTSPSSVTEKSASNTADQFVSEEDVSKQSWNGIIVSGCQGNVGGIVFAQTQPPALTNFCLRVSLEPVRLEKIEQPLMTSSAFITPPYQPPRFL